MNGTSENRTHGEYESSNLLSGENLFYLDRENYELLHVYLEDRMLYEIHIPFDLIHEASHKTISEEAFFEYIEDKATIITTDDNAPNYSELIDFYNSNHPHFSDMTQALMVDVVKKEFDNSIVDLRKDGDMAVLVAAFEDVSDIKEKDRYTTWFGDMGVSDVKSEISPLKFAKRVEEALARINMTYGDYKQAHTFKSTVKDLKQKLISGSEPESEPSVSTPDTTLSSKDQLKEQLENGVRKVLNSDEFKNWLSTSGTMFYKHYSFQNAMLIWFQKPNPTYVMSYERWKDYGRHVAQGSKGAKIFVPLMANEKYKGGLFKSIKNNLTAQLSNDKSLTESIYRLGTSNLEFTMNRENGLIGYRVNGRERQIFGSDEEVKRFIDRAIIGKVPTGFTSGTVFDVSDTVVPEYLWVKKGYTNSEIAPDENGRTMKNKRGEVRIYNTPERQARFRTSLDMKIVQKDSAKMQILFEACVEASKRRGVPVSLADRSDDEVLRSGASGYFSREISEENPYGYIVIDNALEPTEKCSVLLHEMGHSRLHLNLDELALQMGEKKIGREMREVQAEAVAFATASAFGIETDTSSFKYLAVYSRGFELQEFKRSLEVIHAETKALTEDIRAELDIRGFNLDLTEKADKMLNDDTLKKFTSKFLNFASEQGEKVQTTMESLPKLVKDSVRQYELIENLKYQKENLDNRKSDLELMLAQIEELNKATTAQEQIDLIENLESTMKRVEISNEQFEKLFKRYDDLWDKEHESLYTEFKNAPFETLSKMSQNYSGLAKLSKAQLKYVATSLYVENNLKPFLKTDKELFVQAVCERASLITDVASQNGTFVEVSFCEQWTDNPLFENGTICSPKIADKIISESEAQIRLLRKTARETGDYVPYSKCNLTVFSPGADGELMACHTSLNIGDGYQDSLKDHLSSVLKNEGGKKLLEQFTRSLSEKIDRSKIVVQTINNKPLTVESRGKNLTRQEWSAQIEKTKAQKEISNKQKSKQREDKNITE